jgi:hypothetical protein
MERAFEDGVYGELTSEQQAWVADPSSHPALAEDARYPLTLGQLHLLTGASERQLRHWSDEDLIPSHRAGRRAGTPLGRNRSAAGRDADRPPPGWGVRPSPVGVDRRCRQKSRRRRAVAPARQSLRDVARCGRVTGHLCALRWRTDLDLRFPG